MIFHVSQLALFFVYFCSRLVLSSEIENQIFNLRIQETPVKLSEVVNEKQLQVVSVHGQQFACNIPTVNKLSKPIETLLSITNSSEIESILDVWNKTDCLQWSAGWWKYNICIESEIIQYHEATQGVISDQISLGTFKKAYDWSKANPNDLQVKYKYHSQFYENGSKCDVTSLQRSTEVRFVCHDGVPYPTVLELSEIETCIYVVRVAYAGFCSVDVLATRDDVKPSEIICSPSLSDEIYALFLKSEKKRQYELTLQAEIKEFQRVIDELPYQRRIHQESRMRQNRWLRVIQKRLARGFRSQIYRLLGRIEENFYLQNQSNSDCNYMIGQLVDLYKSRVDFRSATKSNDKAPPNQMFKAPNITVAIARILVDHVRKSFEFSVERKQLPNTCLMLGGCIDILQRMISSPAIESLGDVPERLRRRKPRWRTTVEGGPHGDFDRFKTSGDLDNERSLLNQLNTSLILSAKKLRAAHLHSLVMNTLSSSFGGFPVSDTILEEETLKIIQASIEAAAAEGDGGEGEAIGVRGSSALDYEAEMADISSSFLDGLLSPQIQGVLQRSADEASAVPGANRDDGGYGAKKKKELAIKTRLKQMGNGAFIFLVTVQEGATDSNRQRENQINYRKKLSFD